jgi:UDP-glucuronate decarboxylase
VAETLMMDYHRQNKVDTRIARIFNTYGPRMAESDGRVVSNFIVQALRGEPLTLYGDGSQTRSFCYVDDLVDGLIRLMNAKQVHDPVNLGNPGEFSIRELAETIADLCDCPMEIEYRPLPQDDPTQRRPDIARARQLLAWQPTVALREGLERTVHYFGARLRVAAATNGKRQHGSALDAVPFIERRRAYSEAANWVDRHRSDGSNPGERNRARQNGAG